jgi:hypothetical protein
MSTWWEQRIAPRAIRPGRELDARAGEVSRSGYEVIPRIDAD